MARRARIKLTSTDTDKLEAVCGEIREIASKIGVKLVGPIPLHFQKPQSQRAELCSPDPRLTIGTNCRVTLRLAPDVHVSVQGTVVRSSRQEIAIDFLAMDEDSFAHLKMIVEYNAQDADQIDEELVRPAFSPKSPDER